VLDLWSRAAAGQSVTDNATAVRLRLRRDRRLFLLAWDNARLVGSLIGGWDGWRASMARLAVDPAYRRRGIARLLVDRVEQELRSLGATRTGCVVLAANRPARAFWTNSKYRLDTEVVRYVKDLG
jgi:ribosomal protein S18 acetylase RimI-like enzyme